MNEHEHFEKLCALVTSGLASLEEFRELQHHLQDCEECRDRFGEFAQVGAGILMSGSEPGQRSPAGMTERFVARAIAEGVPLHQPVTFLPAWASRPSLRWAGAIAAGVTIAALAAGNLQRFVATSSNHDVVAVQMPVSGASSVSAAPASVATAGRNSLEDTVNKLHAALDTVNSDKEDMEHALDDLNGQVKAKTEHETDLAGKLAELQNQVNQLKQQSAAKDTQIAELGGQLKQDEARNANQLALLAADQIEFRNLKNQAAEGDTTIQNQRQMLAAGSQARDLIIARNLHIIDVHDNNGQGKQQKAFGRIFYTEGKQIIFYAYDLESASRLKKEVAFYVWGGRLGDQHAVTNLGVFHDDDVKAGRWILTFDDPSVLTRINTVFVTVESKKNVVRPDGKQILFAYLGDQANHP